MPQAAAKAFRESQPLAGATTHERAEALIDRVSSTRATFTKADIERAAFHEPDSRAYGSIRPGSAARSTRTPHLSDEQRSAVIEATTRDDLALIVGRAGR